MSVEARWRAVPKALLEDEPMLRSLIEELEAELAAEVHGRGDVLVGMTCQVAGPRVPLSSERRRSWLDKLLRRPAVVDIVTGPYVVLVEGQVLDVICHQLPLAAQQVVEEGTPAMVDAVRPHARCGGGMIHGLADAGGYRTLGCPVHGEVWRRG